jgi:2-keto-4-pentenoate hydratase/2-oxohepta-3-ene-1,7-dioic acid hydratase in catechol pathway
MSVGPWMTTDLDPTDIQVICRINGEEKQNQNTSDLLHPVTKIIEYVSAVITLNPGDVIMTGTPGTPGDIHPGDVVEVEISGVGVLRNPVVAGS